MISHFCCWLNYLSICSTTSVFIWASRELFDVPPVVWEVVSGDNWLNVHCVISKRFLSCGLYLPIWWKKKSAICSGDTPASNNCFSWFGFLAASVMTLPELFWSVKLVMEGKERILVKSQFSSHSSLTKEAIHSKILTLYFSKLVLCNFLCWVEWCLSHCSRFSHCWDIGL